MGSTPLGTTNNTRLAYHRNCCRGILFKTMPYKSEKLKVAGTKFDRRVKLDEYQKACILEERKHDGTSYNKLAFKYGVSKRLIFFICNPEKHLQSKEAYKERRKDGRYYHREKHTPCMREHRRYKQKLYLDEKL